MCEAGKPSPINEKTLKRAFLAERITLLRDDHCPPDALVAFRSTDEEADVFCELYPRGATHDDKRIDRFVWRNDPEPTYLRVLNVSCAVYAETADTDVVERAFRRLPGVSPGPTTLPSPDAVHD